MVTLQTPPTLASFPLKLLPHVIHQIWETTNEMVPMVPVTSWFPDLPKRILPLAEFLSGKFSADLEYNCVSVVETKRSKILQCLVCISSPTITTSAQNMNSSSHEKFRRRKVPQEEGSEEEKQRRTQRCFEAGRSTLLASYLTPLS